MMKPRFTPLFASLLAPTFIILWAPLLTAQAESSHIDRFEIFGGYQYLNIGFYSAEPFHAGAFNGWNAAATANLSKYFGVEGDLGGAYNHLAISGSSVKIYTYSGGPVVYMNKGRIRPFAHALVGGIHTTFSSSGYTVMVGGGVDYNVKKAIAIRLVQADWLYYSLSGRLIVGGTMSHGNNVRISTGVVFRF